MLRVGHILGNAIQCDVVLTEDGSDVPSEGNVHLDLPEHLEGLFQWLEKVLNHIQKQKLWTLLIEYQDIFSKGSHDLGCFTRTPLGFEKERKITCLTLVLS